MMADNLSIEEEQQKMVEEFSMFDDWMARYEYVIDLGRKLPDFPEELRADANKVPGCQSIVWFHAGREGDRLFFQADSDAAIVKGLIALLLRIYSGRTPDEILTTPPSVFEKIELGSHLTGNRANGLHAMVQRIHAYAAAFGKAAGDETPGDSGSAPDPSSSSAH